MPRWAGSVRRRSVGGVPEGLIPTATFLAPNASLRGKVALRWGPDRRPLVGTATVASQGPTVNLRSGCHIHPYKEVTMGATTSAGDAGSPDPSDPLNLPTSHGEVAP